MSHANAPAVLRLAADLLGSYDLERADIASILTDAGIPTDHDDSELTLLARVRMLVTRRAGERRDFRDADVVLTTAGIEPAPNVTLAQRVAELARQRDRYRDDLNHVRELLDGAGIAGDIPAAVEMLLKERAEWRARTSAAPGVVRVGVGWSGYGLSINGDYFGEYCEAREGGWWVYVNGVGTGPLPNEATARAVLLALAGQDCGRVEFGLREDAPIKALLAVKDTVIGCVVECLMGRQTTDGLPPWTIAPAEVRAWVEHGQAALTVKAAPGV